MASQARPFLMTGAALASAATLVVATPALGPKLGEAPLAVANATYDLATFSDVLSIPTSEWVNAYFQGYGGIVGPNNPSPLEPYASQCNGGCVPVGLSAIAYLGFDALINGNGNGWADNANWTVGAINYLYEADWSFDPGGLSAGVQYLLQESIGAANPVLSVAITLAFLGPQLVTVVYDNALQLLSEAALDLPLVGDYVYGAINAYLGPASLDPNFQFYTPGPTGILNYAIDVFIGNAPPSPAPAADPAATVEAAPAAAVALTGPAAEATVEEVAGASATEASGSDESGAADSMGIGAAEALSESPATDAAGSDGAAAAATDAAEAVPAAEASVDPVAETESEADAETAVVSETAADEKATAGSAAVENPRAAAAAAGSESPAGDNPAKSRKRPIRDAVEKAVDKVGKSIESLKGTKADTTAKADATAGTAAADSAN